MSLEQRFTKIRHSFVITILSLVILSVFGLGLAMYETNAIRFSQEVSSTKLHSVVEDDSALAEYLDEQKDYEAHFVTIANLIREDQQSQLGRALIIVTVPTLAFTAVLGYLVARRLLKPVQDAHESQERFIQDAAHELRNPLAAMNVTIQNAKRTKQNPATKKMISTIERQTKRLVRINEDLLFLERQADDAELAQLNLSELLQDILEDMQVHIQRRKQTVELNIQPGLMYKIRPQDFIKITKNLIENAIKYTPPKKQLQISLTSTKSGIELTVQDQGIGIPEEALAQVGERFYRANNVQRVDGTGLGLAIVQKLVNRYGLEFNISSQINSGTTATINFK